MTKAHPSTFHEPSVSRKKLVDTLANVKAALLYVSLAAAGVLQTPETTELQHPFGFGHEHKPKPHTKSESATR